MEEKYYTCQYCKNEFVPKRRRVQKFCSDSCRVSFHRLKNTGVALKSTEVKKQEGNQESQKTKVEQVSAAGVANSALGSGLVEITKRLLTKEENMPATKGDIAKLTSNLSQKKDRYLRIKNMSPNLQGQIPHFDIEKGELVYMWDTFQL